MNALKLSAFTPSLKNPIVSLNRSFRIGGALFNESSFYNVLQIPQNATQSDIKEAYYKLSKIYHPDVRKDENSLAMFRKITEAYDVLGNVRTRLEYDNKIFGKYTSFDTSKDDVYATLYRDTVHEGVWRPEVKKVLNKDPLIDRYLAAEYHDRRVEFKMSKNKQYEHYMEPLGPWGIDRACFVGAVTFVTFTFKFFEWKWQF